MAHDCQRWESSPVKTFEFVPKYEASTCPAVIFKMQSISGVQSRTRGHRPSCFSLPRSAIIPTEIHSFVGFYYYDEQEIIWGKGQPQAFMGISDRARASLTANQKSPDVPGVQDLFHGCKGTLPC